MREIKFRAWDAREKEMLAWPAILYDPDDWLLELLDAPKDGDVLLQYTGLKDKGRKHEIYEGDLLKNKDSDLISRVEFSDGTFWIRNSLFDEPLGKFNHDVEVIGNIYENPELLK